MSRSPVIGFAFLMPFAIAVTVSSSVAAPSVRKPLCPSSSAQSFTFENNITVAFDNVVQKGPTADSVNISYCVSFPGAKNKFLVDWPDSDIRNVSTDENALETRITASSDGHVVRSLAYVGMNRTVVHPGIYQQQGAFIENVKEILTSFWGSVPSYASTPNNRVEHLQPLRLIFDAQSKGDGSATIQFHNEANAGGERITFNFAPAVQLTFPELAGDFTISSETRTIAYNIGKAGPPIGLKTAVTFVNTSHQAIASLPVDIFVSVPDR